MSWLLHRWSSLPSACNPAEPPLTCIAPVQLDKLRSNHVVNVILDISIVKTLITTLVPTLALRIFLLLVPSIMALLCRSQGMASRSQIEFGVIRKYFVFSVSSCSGTTVLPSQCWPCASTC